MQARVREPLERRQSAKRRPSPRAPAAWFVSVLLALGNRAAWQAYLGEYRRVVAERLVHVRYDLHDLAEQGALAVVDDFGDEIGADRLTVGVELDLAIGCIEFNRSQRGLQLGLIVAEVAVDFPQAQDQRRRRVIIIGRKQRRAREALLRREGSLIVFHEGLPARIFPGIGLAAGGDRADQRVLGVALGRKDGLVDHDRAAEQMRLAAGLLVLIEEVDGVRAAKP